MSKSLAVAMTTCPRPTAYIPQALQSLRAAGFTELVHVFSEPDSLVLAQPEVIQHVNTERLGCCPNWKQALHWLLANTTADWLMLLQDDVVWSTGAAKAVRAAMSRPDFQNVGFLSPYTSPAMLPKPTPPDGWVDVQFYNRSFWGALALCLPRSSAQALRDFPRFQNHEHHRKLDVIVGNCFRDMRRTMKVHVPSLADHIGAYSTLGRHKIRGNQWARRGFNWRQNT